MAIIFRDLKGSPLTATEVDGNFRELLNRIEQLEKINPLYETLAEIKQDADEIVFLGSLGSLLGRAKLPVLQMTARGEWQKNINYLVNNLVTFEGSVYLCTYSHCSNDFVLEEKNWQKIFESEKSASRSEKPMLPILTKTSMKPPVFGALALFAGDQNLELLISDVDCWRRLKDMQPFKVI